MKQPKDLPPEYSEEIYLHVNNGGFTFSVYNNKHDDYRWPTIGVTQDHFGHSTKMEVMTTTESIRKIGEMFLRAAKEMEDNEPYCDPAGARTRYWKVNGEDVEEEGRINGVNAEEGQDE